MRRTPHAHIRFGESGDGDGREAKVLTNGFLWHSFGDRCCSWLLSSIQVSSLFRTYSPGRTICESHMDSEIHVFGL